MLYTTEVWGTDNTLKVDLTRHQTMEAASDGTVRHNQRGNTIWEGTAKGCKEIKAELSIDEESKIQLASPLNLLCSYYDKFGLKTPYQSIKTEGRSTITTAPSSKIGGTVESGGDILYKKLIDHKCADDCQTIHARTNAKLSYEDNTVKGTAEDLIQYTEQHKDETTRDFHIKDGADLEVKGDRTITINKGNVSSSGPFDIPLRKKPQEEQGLLLN